MDFSDTLRQAIAAARNGEKIRARSLFIEIVNHDPRNELAWMWLSGLFESPADKINACENVLRINPNNTRIRMYLESLQKDRTSPKRVSRSSQPNGMPTNPYTIEHALNLEEEGNRDEALQVYQIMAAKASDRKEFDRIYQEITRLENLKTEEIKHVSSRLTLARLTAGWPIFYFLLVLIQNGLRLFTLSTFYLWLGLIWVSIGGFFVALVEIRPRHPMWEKIYLGRAVGRSGLMRFFLRTSGLFLISISFLLLAFDSINRLRVFDIPFPP